MNLEKYSPCGDAVVIVSGSGDNILVAPVAGQATRVYRIYFVTDGATAITFKRGSTALTGPMPLEKNGSLFFDLNSVPWFTTAENEAFILHSTNAVSITGRIEYKTW